MNPLTLRPTSRSRETLALAGLLAILGCGRFEGEVSRDCAPRADPGAVERAPFDRIVLVTIDTLRADHVGHYGYFRPTTPFLDELADRGTAFMRANSASSHTLPAHASILTGLLPSEHGASVNGALLRIEHDSLPCLCRRAEMDTAAFVSVNFLAGLAVGFRTFGEPEPGTVYRLGESTVTAALNWFDAARAGDRFFLWVHLYDAHEWEFQDPAYARDHEALREADAPSLTYAALARLHGLPEQDEGGFRTLDWGQIRKQDDRFLVRSRGEATAWVDEYDARVRYVDRQIRRLYEHVEGAGIGGRSLWIVTADHGEGLGSHGYKGHGRYVYQEQLHVPLLIHARDGSLQNAPVEQLASHVDLFWTLREWWGLDDPARYGRASLAGLLRGESAELDRILYAERRPADDYRVSRGWIDERVVAALDRGHKYILHSMSTDEAFDLTRDPLETSSRVAPSAEGVTRLLNGLMEHYADAPEAETSELSEEVAEQLRELGYVE